MTTTYESKIDALILGLLGSSVAICVAACVVVLRSSTPGAWWICLPILAIGAGLPLWLLLATRYTLDSTMLRVRSGPFRWRIPVADITSIKPSRSTMSGPALSLDRLSIAYGRGNVLLISPRDQ